MKKKLIISFIGIAVIFVGGITFIHFSNDHEECENVIEYYVDTNSKEITHTKHICKERINI